MRNFLFLLIIILSPVFSFAQQHNHTEPCGFDKMHEEKLKNDPAYRLSVEQMEETMLRMAKQGGITKKAGIIKIPIVFHVIHHGEPVGTVHNISDAQVESAVRGLNVYYRNNKKWPATPAVPVNPNGVDQEIEFCLAQRTPNGQPTNGINRVDGRTYTNYQQQGLTSANENAIVTAVGWDKNKYYNVFVVSEINDQGGNGSGNVGNANFPPGNTTPSPTNDRTVIIWKTCGYIDASDSPQPPYKNTSLTAPYDNNTMVHEMGHAFSLYHTFANDNGDLASQGGGTGQPASACGTAENATNCATRGDRVCDTDRHLGNLGSCPTVGSTMNECTGTPYGVNIASNIMNYTNCSPGLFTAGQRDRIALALSSNQVRKNLAASDACNSVFPYDLALVSLSAPSGFQCNGDLTPKLTVKNTGQNEITSFELVYGVDGNFDNTYTWTGSLPSNTEITITATTFATTVGAHSFSIKVVNSTINLNQLDGFANNNQLSGSVEIISGSLLDLTASEYSSGADFLEIREAGNGPIVTTISFDDASGSLSKKVCLPNRCFDIILVDQSYNPANPVVGGVPSGCPKFTLKDEKGFELAKGFTNAAFAAPNGINNGQNQPRKQTFANICLPFDPGYLNADFKANQFVIVTGTTIQFTDLSSAVKPGAPAANSWSWTFGDGGTSTLKDPTRTYTTPGVYEVSLTVNNGTLPDTETKKNYIRVIAPLTGCDNFNNLLNGETPAIVNNPNAGAGYYPGPNSANVTSYAERFWTPSASTLRSVDIYAGYKVVANPNTMVNVVVYANGGGLPSTILGSTKVPLADLTSSNYTNVSFATPINVNDYYFVGVEMDLPAGDTLVIGTAAYRGEPYSNTAFTLVNNEWKSSTDFLTGSSAHSLGLKANLSVKPKAVINSDVLQICLTKSIIYNANSSSFATGGYNWIFEGGSPATSTNATQSVLYNSQGIKNVTLVAKGGCNESDSAKTTIKVTDKLEVTIDGVDESCFQGNGLATAKPTGGSGDYSYKWNTIPQQTTIIATNLKAGTYTLTLTDAKCGATTKAVTINNSATVPDFPTEVVNTSCGLSNGSAKAEAVGIAAPTYKWTNAAGALISNSKSVSGLAAGSYTIEVSDPGCQPNTKTVTIEASSGIAAGISQSATSVCKGETVMFVANGGTAYVWNDGAQDVAFTDTLVISPSSSGTYSVRVSNQAGCSVQLKRDIAVTLSPTAIAGVDNDNNDVYDSIAVVDICKQGVAFFSSAGSIGKTFTWDFGNGKFSNVKNPFHRYTDVGMYKAVLTVDNDGCINKDSVYVNVICSTGLNELLKDQISLYPNPSAGIVNIENLNGLKIEAVSLIDVLGRATSLSLSDGKTIDMSAFANGIYIIKIDTDKGSIAERIELLR